MHRKFAAVAALVIVPLLLPGQRVVLERLGRKKLEALEGAKDALG